MTGATGAEAFTEETAFFGAGAVTGATLLAACKEGPSQLIVETTGFGSTPAPPQAGLAAALDTLPVPHEIR